MKISPKLFPLFVLLPFALALGAAKVSGYWQPKGGRGCGGESPGYHGGRHDHGEATADIDRTAPGPGEEGFECPLEDICEFKQCDPTTCGISDGECSANLVLDSEPAGGERRGMAGGGCDDGDHDGDGHGHGHDAGMFRGYNTLADAAQHYGLSFKEVKKRLSISEGVPASTRLRAIADEAGCSVHDLRDLLEGGE